MHYVYILRSVGSGVFYYGYTTDLRRRFTEHQNGACNATRKFAPLKLVWYCAFLDESKAKEFEAYLKRGSGHGFSRKHLL